VEGQARIAGQLWKEVELGGKKYTLSKPNLVGIYGEIEAWIVSRKTDPLVLAVKACQQAPAAMHPIIWEAAMKTASAARIANLDEMEAFRASRWCVAFMFWKALNEKHREEVPDLDAAMKLIESCVDVDALIANVNVVNGEADLKNWCGPSAARADQQTETQPMEAGPTSTDSSPNGTDGPPSK
jgi:hypothetical protein